MQTDYKISADVTPTNFNGGIGFAVRVQNPAETNLLSYMNAGRPITQTDEASAKGGTNWMKGYYIEINAARILINKNNYSAERVASANYKFEKNVQYKIEVECIDDTIRVYVNGEMVLEYVDDKPYLNGMMGYKMTGGGAIFDNFAIKAVESK